MILSIGEILADIVAYGDNLKMKVGGAPFNVAAGIAAAGGKSIFLGRVGNDLVGRFLIERSAFYGIDTIDIQIDENRNTTLAFVTLDSGERSFSFFRNDSADYNIELEKSSVFDTDYRILHLGSLMLSRPEGVNVAEKAVAAVRNKGALLSFDVNFRFDLFDSPADAFKVSKFFIESADIVKFNDEEITAYTGENDIDSAVKKVWRNGKIIVVTKGKDGSLCMCPNGELISVSGETVTPLDTTGAGDAFFGAFLSSVEGSAPTTDNFKTALTVANGAGAKATMFYGALGYLEKTLS